MLEQVQIPITTPSPQDNGASLKELRMNQNSQVKSNIWLEGYFNLGHFDWSVPLTLLGKPDQDQHKSVKEGLLHYTTGVYSGVGTWIIFPGQSWTLLG